jgi:hypothetical protein
MAWAVLVGLTALIGGCMNPVITGGEVTFKVYVASEAEATLIAPDWQVEKAREPVLARAKPVQRFVVIPQYQAVKEPAFFPAQLVTADSGTVLYPRRLQLATWAGRERLPWETYPSDRSFLYAWVFVEGCWPAFVGESVDVLSPLMTGGLRTRWGGWKDMAPGLEGDATVICFPLSHPWDNEVAAAAGCHHAGGAGERFYGHWETLYAMAAVPCWIISAVEQSKDLSAKDRLMVYRHVLRLYEQTRPYWTDPPTAPGAAFSNALAYPENTKLLRQRIQELENLTSSSAKRLPEKI